MKKILMITMLGAVMSSLVACTSNKADTTNQNATTEISLSAEKSSEVREKTPELVYSGEEVGNGNFYVSTPGGTSADGNIPVIYGQKDTIIYQLGISSEGMDGSLLSYIYIDGKEMGKQQMSDSSGSIELDGSFFQKTAEHDVECIQYENNDVSGKAVFYRHANFKIEVE